MKASRTPYPYESYWASNFVYGIGMGTSSIIYGVMRGVGGVVYDPYIGAKQKGLRGGGIGVVKGLGGLMARPIKGAFDFVAQPIVGVINTPHFLYKKLTVRKTPKEPKVTNFSIFGVDNKQDGKRVHNPITDETTVLIFDGEEY